VTPDIALPDPYAQIPYGEKEDKFAIAWDEIPAAKYDAWNATYNLNDLKAHSTKRVVSDPSFQLIQQESNDYKQRRENTLYSLNYKKFSAQQIELDVKQKKYDVLANDSTRVNVSNLPVDLPKINADSVSVARNAQFIKNLKKDIYLSEASQVVAEMK
jgi:carboxyl-terminal processing protease